MSPCTSLIAVLALSAVSALVGMAVGLPTCTLALATFSWVRTSASDAFHEVESPETKQPTHCATPDDARATNYTLLSDEDFSDSESECDMPWYDPSADESFKFAVPQSAMTCPLIVITMYDDFSEEERSFYDAADEEVPGLHDESRMTLAQSLMSTYDLLSIPMPSKGCRNVCTK